MMITKQMVESGARAMATCRGHKDVEHVIRRGDGETLVVWQVYAEEVRAALNAALQGSVVVPDMPSREVIAREIRRAMLDNPTDDSFNKRAEKREAIANDAADVILARFKNGRAFSRQERGDTTDGGSS
jgi:hypothetical protein